MFPLSEVSPFISLQPTGDDCGAGSCNNELKITFYEEVKSLQNSNSLKRR